MRSPRSQILVAAMIGLTVASLAEAQQRPPRRPTPPNAGAAAQTPPQDGPRGNARRGPGAPGDMAGPRGGRRGPGAGNRGNPAAMLLGLREQLALTDDQVKRLETLQGAAKPKSSAADQMRARADLMDAMQGDGNLTAARAAMDKMNRARTDEAIGKLKLRQDARAVLTAGQRSKLESFRPQGGRGGRGKAMGGRRQRGGMQGGRPQGFRQGGRPQGFRQGGQGRGPMRPGMMPPRGRRGGEMADTLTY